jgi:hypothetical protein
MSLRQDKKQWEALLTFNLNSQFTLKGQQSVSADKDGRTVCYA